MALCSPISISSFETRSYTCSFFIIVDNNVLCFSLDKSINNDVRDSSIYSMFLGPVGPGRPKLSDILDSRQPAIINLIALNFLDNMETKNLRNFSCYLYTYIVFFLNQLSVSKLCKRPAVYSKTCTYRPVTVSPMSNLRLCLTNGVQLILVCC
jgi:hypothetical protein